MVFFFCLHVSKYVRYLHVGICVSVRRSMLAPALSNIRKSNSFGFGFLSHYFDFQKLSLGRFLFYSPNLATLVGWCHRWVTARLVYCRRRLLVGKRTIESILLDRLEWSATAMRCWCENWMDYSVMFGRMVASFNQVISWKEKKKRKTLDGASMVWYDI